MKHLDFLILLLEAFFAFFLKCKLLDPKRVVGPCGLEPQTSCVSSRRVLVDKVKLRATASGFDKGHILRNSRASTHRIANGGY
jgi:hypothetical protein